MVSFTIRLDGTVVKDSIEVRDAQPIGLFDASAVDAASKFTFPPLSTIGQLQPIPSYLHVFRYALTQVQHQTNEDLPPSPTH